MCTEAEKLANENREMGWPAVPEGCPAQVRRKIIAERERRMKAYEQRCAEGVCVVISKRADRERDPDDEEEGGDQEHIDAVSDPDSPDYDETDPDFDPDWLEKQRAAFVARLTGQFPMLS